MIVQASAKKVAYRYLAAKQEREASKLRDILNAWIQQPLRIMFDTIKSLPKNAFDDVLDVAIGEALPKIAIEIQKAKVQKDFDGFKRGVIAGATAKRQGDFIGKGSQSSYPNWEKCLKRGEKCDWEREGFLFGYLHYASLGPQMNMSSKDRNLLLKAMITYQKKSLSQNVVKGLIWDVITDLNPKRMWKKMKESMKSHGKKVGLVLGIVLFIENVVIPLYVMPLLGLPPLPLPLEAVILPVVLNKLGVIAIDDVHHTPVVDQHLSGKDQKLMLRDKRQLRKSYLII